MNKRIDKDAARLAATGRWPDILSSLGSVDRALLDGRHHPCPKCGGEDRFRLLDEATGALICNQCFNKKNGDGFAALQWLTGRKFNEVLSDVAAHVGLQANGHKQIDPEKDLDWRPWSSDLVANYIGAKPGVSEAAILAAGGRLARYKDKYTVVAFPIIGESLDVEKPVGWVIVNAMGGTLPRWDRQGNIIDQLKVKVTAGSGTGLVGLLGIERLKTVGLVERAWKCEGITDLLALSAKIPAGQVDRHVVVSNANGASEKPRWRAGFLAAVPDTCVIHDADKPGDLGAKVWCSEIAAAGGKSRHVSLPYPIAENHGKDVRDWLNQGNDYSDLCSLADQSIVVAIAKTATGEIDYSKAEYPVQERILQLLQIEVLRETEDGKICIFSSLLKKSSWITRGELSRLRKEVFVQICGATAMVHISSDPDGEVSWSAADVREAIALMASTRRTHDDERGVGVWQGHDGKGHELNTVILVGNTEAAQWDGTELTRITRPRTNGMVLDFGSGHEDWFDFDELLRWMPSAQDPAWCSEVIDLTRKLFLRWNWRSPRTDPDLMVGLCLASWVQTIWSFRPLVVVTGPTNCGKSMLFEALGGSGWRRGIFGALAFKQAKSTEAGLRQGIGNTARVILCDEFEKSRERDVILNAFRASSRGDQTARGTAGDQKGRVFSWQHVAWVAAIEGGLKDQADVNRFVQFELKGASAGKENELVLPENGELSRLGQKLLAIATVHAVQAKAMAMRLKSTKVKKIDPRTIEVYAVPAAILASALGLNDESAAKLLAELLSSVEADTQGKTDEGELLQEILSATIFTGSKHGHLAVSQILDSTSDLTTYRHQLEAMGISMPVKKEGEPQRLWIVHSVAGEKLLKGTSWEGKRIDQLLMRLPEAVRLRRHVAGKLTSLISVIMPDDPAPTDDGHAAF